MSHHRSRSNIVRQHPKHKSHFETRQVQRGDPPPTLLPIQPAECCCCAMKCSCTLIELQRLVGHLQVAVEPDWDRVKIGGTD